LYLESKITAILSDTGNAGYALFEEIASDSPILDGFPDIWIMLCRITDRAASSLMLVISDSLLLEFYTQAFGHWLVQDVLVTRVHDAGH